MRFQTIEQLLMYYKIRLEGLKVGRAAHLSYNEAAYINLADEMNANMDILITQLDELERQRPR